MTTPALAVVSELNSSDGPPSPPRAGPTPRVTGSHITHINEHPADTDTREITTSRIYFCTTPFIFVKGLLTFPALLIILVFFLLSMIGEEAPMHRRRREDAITATDPHISTGQKARLISIGCLPGTSWPVLIATTFITGHTTRY